MATPTPTHPAMQRLLVAVLLTLPLAACGPKSPDDSTVLAKVDGRTITEKDYDDYLRARQAQVGPMADPKKEREAVLDEMVNRLLLTEYAEDKGVDRELDVYLLLKRQRENTLVRAALRQRLRDQPITDDEVRKRYDQEVAKTHKTEYQARHILVATETDARDIAAKLRRGADFATLARQYSLDTHSKDAGGDLGVMDRTRGRGLGWINQGMIEPELFAAMITLRKGDISEPVRTEHGYHVLRVDGTRPLAIPEFDKMKGDIYQLIQQERIDTLVKELKAKTKIVLTPAPTAAPAPAP